MQSQRAPAGGPPPNPTRHQRSSSANPPPQAPTLERRSVGSEGPLGAAASATHAQPVSSGRPERHKRSMSDNFDGGERAGMPSAEPLGMSTSA